MADIPIIFSAPMVQALLAGRKTQTRRLAWQKPRVAIQVGDGPIEPILVPSAWQKVKPGDRIWVRENIEIKPEASNCYFAADRAGVGHDAYCHLLGRVKGWRARVIPAIHMPRPVSRLTLIVEAVKVERLQAISEADAKAEGVLLGPTESALDSDAYRGSFGMLWRSLHGKGPADFTPWNENPEVVAVTFRVERQNIDRIAA
jgi:hypothetical protein